MKSIISWPEFGCSIADGMPTPADDSDHKPAWLLLLFRLSLIRVVRAIDTPRSPPTPGQKGKNLGENLRRKDGHGCACVSMGTHLADNVQKGIAVGIELKQ